MLSAFDDRTHLTRIPLTDIRRLQVSDSRRTAGQAFRGGAGRGALVGLGLSAGLMAIGVVTDRRNDDTYNTGTRIAALGSVLLTTLTTVTGGLIGLGGRERWRTVPLDRTAGSHALTAPR
ncbi:MAG: hypothetical protein V4813_11710 [Gemmatimonadota bacterium]